MCTAELLSYNPFEHLRIETRRQEKVEQYINGVKDLSIDPIGHYLHGLSLLAYLMDRSDNCCLKYARSGALSAVVTPGNGMLVKGMFQKAIEEVSAFTALQDILDSQEVQERFDTGFRGSHPGLAKFSPTWSEGLGYVKALNRINKALINPTLVHRIASGRDYESSFDYRKKAFERAGFSVNSPAFCLSLLISLDIVTRDGLLRLPIPLLRKYSNEFPVLYSRGSLEKRRQDKGRILERLLLGNPNVRRKSNLLGEQNGSTYLHGYLALVRKTIGELLEKHYQGNEQKVASIIGNLTLMNTASYGGKKTIDEVLDGILTPFSKGDFALAREELEKLGRQNPGLIPGYEFVTKGLF
jgi:hypothetical protein